MSNLFDQALNNINTEVKNRIDHSFNIVDQIFEILEEKGLNQKDLADLMGKKESEISKWMTGRHNFTLNTIAKLESVLKEDIITTPAKARRKYREVQFVPVKTFARVNRPVINKEVTDGIMESSQKNIFNKGIKSA